MPEIENTIITPYYNNEGVLRAYSVAPINGYLMHFLDPEAEAADRSIPTFTQSTVSVGYNYDFENVLPYVFTYKDENNEEKSISTLKVGRFGLFAIPFDLVPHEEILGTKCTK